MSSKELRPLNQWGNLQKLLEHINKQKPVDGESVESRAETLRNILYASPFIAYLCKDVYTDWTVALVQNLYPESIKAEYAESEDNYPPKDIKPYKNCEELSKKMMETKINGDALGLITDLDQKMDDEGDEGDKDESKSLDPKVQEELDRLRTLVNGLPGEVAPVPESVQRIQKDAFTTIEKYYKSLPPKPNLFKATYTEQELKTVAESTGRTETQVKEESAKYSEWYNALEKEHQDIELRIKREIESVGKTDVEKQRSYGTIPLMAMGDMWGRVEGKRMHSKDFDQAIDQLWLKFQFPRNWTRMPPVNDVPLPTAEELQRGVDMRQQAQRDLDALKGKNGIVVTKDSSDGSAAASGASSDALVQSTSSSDGARASSTSTSSAAPVQSRPSGALIVSSTGMAQLSERMTAFLRLVEKNGGTGAFPGNQGQLGAGNRAKANYRLEIVSEKSGQGQIFSPNTTEKGDQIVAWFQRTRTMKDDDDERIKATQTNRYFVVRKQNSKGLTTHEVISAELCGAERAWKALERDKVPELWDSKKLSELPSKKQIGKVDWGIEWIAARSKVNVKEGAREIPVLVLCMWWLMEEEDLENEAKPLKFNKGVKPGNHLLRQVVLNRGEFHSTMGKERADAQICETMPHPDGDIWESVEECIRYYTTEKSLAPRGQLVKRS